MAAPEAYEILENDRSVEQNKSWTKNGILVAAGQSVRIYGSVNFFAFIMSKNLSSGVMAVENAACGDAADWTDFYTCPTGYEAYISIHVANVGSSGAETFSLAVTATHVDGESAPA